MTMEKMEWKNNRKLTVSLFIHEVQSHIKGNKFHVGAFISKQVGVHLVQDAKLLDSKKCFRLIYKNITTTHAQIFPDL